LASLVALAALAVVILAVWKLPSLLYGDVSEASADARLQAGSGFRTALVAGLAGLAALGSLAMASRNAAQVLGQILDAAVAGGRLHATRPRTSADPASSNAR
jgi:hypothetical protein